MAKRIWEMFGAFRKAFIALACSAILGEESGS